MSIIDRMRKQDGVYWAPVAQSKFGASTVAAPVQLTGKVRWEDKLQKVIGEDGEEILSHAEVYLPEVAAGVEAKVGGFLWLGLVGSAPADPRAHKQAHEIKAFAKMPDFKAKKFLRIAYL